jgi:hypothetical protein
LGTRIEKRRKAFLARRVQVNGNATAATGETTSVTVGAVIGSLFVSDYFVAHKDESDEEENDVEESEDEESRNIALADSTPKGSDEAIANAEADEALENKEADNRGDEVQPTELQQTLAKLAMKGLNNIFEGLIKNCPGMHGLHPDSRAKINDGTVQMTNLVPDPLIRDLPMNDDTAVQYFFRNGKIV